MLPPRACAYKVHRRAKVRIHFRHSRLAGEQATTGASRS
jgi:hypothetical protein